jgi:AcrR family transcriptional regulator
MDHRMPSLRMRQRKHTESEIVRVAFELFGEHGYEDVSVEMIAAAAGISRATFFNYFPQKELILREVAAARAAKLKSVLAEARASVPAPTIDAIVELLLKLTEENARISVQSKKLLLEAVFHQVSRGLLLDARDAAIAALTEILRSIGSRKKAATLIAETLFAVFLATMLEWLMRDGVPEKWLVETMRGRLRQVIAGVR